MHDRMRPYYQCTNTLRAFLTTSDERGTRPQAKRKAARVILQTAETLDEAPDTTADRPSPPRASHKDRVCNWVHALGG
jgi:hypothetical protein